MIHRLRAGILISTTACVIVFAGYSIPAYFHLLAHQPDRNPVTATSFPPSYAFLVGGFLAFLTWIAVGVIALVLCVTRKPNNDGKPTPVILSAPSKKL